jgi:hypothetical protein
MDRINKVEVLFTMVPNLWSSPHYPDRQSPDRSNNFGEKRGNGSGESNDNEYDCTT